MNGTAPWRVVVCSGGFAACVVAEPHGATFVALVVALECVLASVLFVDRRVLTVLALLVASALGTWRGSSAAVDHGEGGLAGHLGNGSVVLRGHVADSGVPGRDDTVVVEVAQLATSAGSWRVSGAVFAEPRTGVDVLPGDTVEVSATTLRAPPQRPGALSAVSLERVGVVALAPAAQVTVLATAGPSVARVAAQLRRSLAADVARVLPEPEATLVLGVAFGIHGRLVGAVRAPLQDAGLIHVVAVSGLKVVMVAGLVRAVGRVRGWTRRRTTVVTLAVVGSYVVLSGAGPAALRSSAMVGAGLLLARDGRRPHSFALMGLCAAALLAIEPAVAADVGFQLSFLGTTGILVLARPLAARLPGPRLLVEPFAVTVAAQLATTAVTAGTFGVVSLVGPAANALVIPLLPLVIVAGGAGGLAGAYLPVVGPALGWLPLQVGALAVRVLLAVAQGASALPFAALHVSLWPASWTLIEVVAVLAAGAAWWGSGRPRRLSRRVAVTAVLAAVLAGSVTTVGLAATTRAALRVTVLDVGNGVAVLVETPGGGEVLVDGGPDGAALLAGLGRVLSPLQRHLDAVVLTATDRASAAALPGLVGHYDVGTLVVSQPLPTALEAAAAQLSGRGTAVVTLGAASWALGGVTVRCIPSGPAVGAPCAIQLSDGPQSVLVTGTLPTAGQDELVGMGHGGLGADLLVAPTTTAPSPALLAAVRPALVAVPALRAPPGLGASGLPVDVTGRDSDLSYEGDPGGGFAPAYGIGGPG